MGILDFFRRNASVSSTEDASHVDSASFAGIGGTEPFSGRSTERPQASESGLGTSLEESGFGTSLEESTSTQALNGGQTATIPAPPAWSVLAPISTVAQRSMQPSFDSGVSTKLRSLRGPDALFVSTGLSHTVDRKASGVIDGLITPSAAPATYVPWQTDSEQVLRRKHPTAAQLPALDVAHSRWPILSRMIEAAPVRRNSDPSLSSNVVFPGSQSGSPSTLSNDAAQAEMPLSVQHQSDVSPSDTFATNLALDGSSSSQGPAASVDALSLIPNSSQAPAEPNRDALPITSTSSTFGLVGSSLQRTLSTVSSDAGSSRLVLPKPQPAMPAFDAPVINRQVANGASTLASEPLAVSTGEVLRVHDSVRPTLSAPSASNLVSAGIDRSSDSEGGSSSVFSAPSIPSSVPELVNLRRRSIVEMPSISEAASQPLNTPTERTPSTIARAFVDGASSGDWNSSASGAELPRPTLGRKAGLGEPIAAVPESARQAALGEISRSLDPFAGWNDPAPDHAHTNSALANQTLPDLTLVENNQGSAIHSGLGGMQPASGADAFPIARFTDESSGENGSLIGSANSSFTEAQQQSTPLLGDSYLRVVGSEGETNPTFSDAASLPPVTTTERPLLGEQSMVHRLSDGSAGETLLASSLAVDDSQGPAALVVPLQRGVGQSLVDEGYSQTQRNYDGATSRDASGLVDPVGVLTSSDGSDSFPSPAPRALQRVPDAGPTPQTALTSVNQSQRPLSPVTSAPILRERPQPAQTLERGAIAGLSVARSADATGVVPLIRSSSSGALQRSFSWPMPMSASIGSGANAPAGGNLALLERAIDRGSQHPESSFSGDNSTVGPSASPWVGEAASWSSTVDQQSDANSWLQREADEVAESSVSAPPSPAPSGSSEVPAGSTAGGASATGSSAQAETDLEMLAGRIYDRIRNRLRRELLDDRERAGLTLDRVR
jgi:hypothetical protein